MVSEVHDHDEQLQIVNAAEIGGDEAADIVWNASVGPWRHRMSGLVANQVAATSDQRRRLPLAAATTLCTGGCPPRRG
jgi:hypothetical protein